MAASILWGSPLRLDREQHPQIVEVLQHIGASVCADGSNGQTVVSPQEAELRGLYCPPGAASVPLVAYHPEDQGSRSSWVPAGRHPMGLDSPDNSRSALRGEDGAVIGWRYFGVLTDEDGQPIVQGAEDPCPGAWLSTTALLDGRYVRTDARRYFDAVSLPGWVLPGHDLDGLQVRIGDLALVSFGETGAEIWCQCFDVGNSGTDRIELSVAACEQLGINPDARRGGCSSGVKVTILPGSRATYWDAGKLHTLSADQIGEAGRAAARAAGLRMGD